MMVGIIVAGAIVITVFFGVGMAFGVFWIYARSVRMERKPGKDRDPDDSHPGEESWPFQH